MYHHTTRRPFQPSVELIPTKSSREHFDFARLKEVCEVHETVAGHEWGAEKFPVDQHGPSNYYWFKDNGAKILAVAHLDTCVDHIERGTVLAETAGGDVVYSGALDDRLGAYVIVDLLPKLGIEVDWLFTVGEEDGMSTAQFFEPSRHHDREYNWIIEFDRGHEDVVAYQYEDADLVEKVQRTGLFVEQGAFSDISFLEHLGRKALNWGVAYRDYHSTRGHVWLNEFFPLIDAFVAFHAEYKDEVMPHEPERHSFWGRGGYFRPDDDTTDDDTDETLECEAEGWVRTIDCSGTVETTEYGDLCSRHFRWIDCEE